MLEDNLSACDMDCGHPLQIEESRLAEICNSQKRSQNFLQKKKEKKKSLLYESCIRSLGTVVLSTL